MPTYRFVAWLDEIGNPISNEPTINLVVERDVTITAQYEELAPAYQLTLTPDRTDYYKIENILLAGFLKADGSPVAGAPIKLYRNGAYRMETTTLGDGSYSFEDPAATEGIIEYYTEHTVAGLISRSDSIIVRRSQ